MSYAIHDVSRLLRYFDFAMLRFYCLRFKARFD